MASKGRRYRTVVVEGYEVLIGKGDADNDELTFALAAPEDFWLHVAGGVPGSHVVVRNPDKLDALPRAVVERAAELAARHSKARDARRVDVHLCRVADVSGFGSKDQSGRGAASPGPATAHGLSLRSPSRFPRTARARAFSTTSGGTGSVFAMPKRRSEGRKRRRKRAMSSIGFRFGMVIS